MKCRGGSFSLGTSFLSPAVEGGRLLRANDCEGYLWSCEHAGKEKRVPLPRPFHLRFRHGGHCIDLFHFLPVEEEMDHQADHNGEAHRADDPSEAQLGPE